MDILYCPFRDDYSFACRRRSARLTFQIKYAILFPQHRIYGGRDEENPQLLGFSPKTGCGFFLLPIWTNLEIRKTGTHGIQ